MGVGDSPWLVEGSHRNPAAAWPSSGCSGPPPLTFKETRDSDNWLQLGVRSQAGQQLMDAVGFTTCITRALLQHRDMTSNQQYPKKMEHGAICMDLTKRPGREEYRYDRSQIPRRSPQDSRPHSRTVVLCIVPLLYLSQLTPIGYFPRCRRVLGVTSQN